MPSAFSWLHFDESDRQRAMQVIDLFREKGTVDELGFAPIRDAFADHLFPGTSTIQTRARYFFFVPWIMQDVTKRGRTSQQIADKIRKREVDLITALLAGGDEQEGIIGRESRGALKRMPSNAYWRGLFLWGIRLSAVSIEQYQRKLAREGDGLEQPEILIGDKEPLAPKARVWHPALPKRPDDLEKQATFQLTPEEAEFLRERICTNQPASVLAHLLRRAESRMDADYVWDESVAGMLPPNLKRKVDHARLFAWGAEGAPLVYAMMLAEMKGSDESIADLEIRLAAWQEQLRNADAELRSWDRDAFWILVSEMHSKLSSRTRAFATAWIEVALRASAGEPIWQDAAVRKLIYARECHLKGALARLIRENHRVRDRWQRDVGGGAMDYRWGPAQIVLNDIIAGLHGSAEDGPMNA